MAWWQEELRSESFMGEGQKVLLSSPQDPLISEFVAAPYLHKDPFSEFVADTTIRQMYWKMEANPRCFVDVTSEKAKKCLSAWHQAESSKNKRYDLQTMASVYNDFLETFMC